MPQNPDADPLDTHGQPPPVWHVGSSVNNVMQRVSSSILSQQITTQTYANGFFVVAIMAAIGAVLAAFMRAGKKKGGGSHGPVEL